MYRKIFNFTVTILTILTANLVTNYITDMLISYKWQIKPLRFTLIAMAVITLVFYPLFTMLQKWLDKLSRKFVKAGHSFAGRYLGFIVMAVLGLFILICIYAHQWYHINVIKMVASGTFFSAF